MTRLWVLLLVGVLAGIAALAGVVFVARTYLFAGAKASNPSESAAVSVQVIQPRPGGLERTVTRPITIHAFQFADLYAKVAGYLHNQGVDIGSAAEKNELLAEIEAPEINTNVQQATADLAKAKSQVEVMRARQTAAQASVEEATVKVEQTKADLASASAMQDLRTEQYKRIQKLVELKSIEPELADEKLEAKKAAEADVVAKRKAVNTAQVAVATAMARLAEAGAELQDARSQVQVAEAALARAKVFQGYLQIRAPFAGVITQRNYHEGDFIREGTSVGHKPVLSVARTDVMRGIVDVPDPDVPFTHQGSKADVEVDALPGQVIHGKVARTARSEDYNSRTMRTEIDLPNPEGNLASGMFGKATIYLGSDPHAVTIPSTCLTGQPKDDQRSVFVVQDGKARLVPVRVGRDDGISVEVRSGLKATDQVIAGHGAGLA